MSDLKFDSIIREMNPKGDKWIPQVISKYEGSLRIEGEPSYTYAFCRDIWYSLQYLEYLQKQLYELRLTDPIIKMLYKSYIITAIGIIELLFSYAIKTKGLFPQDEYKEIKGSKKTFALDKNNLKMVTYCLERTDKYYKEIDFNTLIEIIITKKVFSFSDDEVVKKILKSLKHVRNKVHLTISKTPNDTDWNTFDKTSFILTRALLHRILTDELFISTADALPLFDFIIPSKAEAREALSKFNSRG